MNEFNQIACLLPQYAVSSQALLEWLQPRVDDEILMQIADMDSGMDYGQNYEALMVIRDQLVVPARFDPIPGEVLELMRWCVPESDPDTPEMRIHLARAFSCAALLRACNTDGLNIKTLILLTVSVLYLGREASVSALRFFLWRVNQVPLFDREALYILVVILILAVRLFEPCQDEANLMVLVGLIESERARVETELSTNRVACNVLSDRHYTYLDDWDNEYTQQLQGAANIVLSDPAIPIADGTSTAIRTAMESLTPNPR